MLDFIFGKSKAKKRKEEAKKAVNKKLSNDSNFGSQYSPAIDLADEVSGPSVKKY